MATQGDRIRAARAWADLSQDELAAQLGVDVQWVKRREGGSQGSKDVDLIAIASVCDVPLDFLRHGFPTQAGGGEAQFDRIEQALAGLVQREEKAKEQRDAIQALLARQDQILADIRRATSEHADAAALLNEGAQQLLDAALAEQASPDAQSADQAESRRRRAEG